nr:PQQ-binding-like beta-propeller repeat protein [Bacteroidota bacterium]
MEPYEITAPRPSFIIVSGDICEFSVPGVTWDVNRKYYEGIDIPVYLIAGNHDNTWVSAASKFRDLYGGLNYSFDYGGCHFIGLNSATIQEPIQSFDEVTVNFLKKDLEEVDSGTPVFMYFHHPLYGGGFASQYDCDRILDLVRDHNVVLLMDGHGHSAVKHDYPGVDGVEGGSTFGEDPSKVGFNIVNIKDNKLYVAYKESDKDSAVKGLLEKEIKEKSDYVKISFASPKENEVVKKGNLELKVAVSHSLSGLTGSGYELDDEQTGEMSKSGSNLMAELNIDDLCNGAHFIRVKFTIDRNEYQKSVSFFVDKPGRENMGIAKWRYKMKGSSQSTPLVFNNTVHVGSNDGLLYAVNEEDGELQWSFNAGAEIISSPAVYQNLILFGAGNGKFYALTTIGKVKWSYDAGAPVYSSPAVDEAGIVYFGNNKAELTALDAKTGNVIWINKDAKFSVESKPFVMDNNVYFGAWDGCLYSVDKKSGETAWKKSGPKNIELQRNNTYYGPADNGPLVTSDKVYITDRGYIAGIYLLDGTYQKAISKTCSAMGFSENKNCLYLRSTSQPLSKTDLDGNVLWESSEVLGRFPVSPLEKDGKVYVCNNTGMFYALDAQTGKVLWQYQVTPKLYVMSGLSVNNGVVYTTGMDGYISAFFNH